MDKFSSAPKTGQPLMSFQQNLKIPVWSRYCPLTQTTFTRSVLGNALVVTRGRQDAIKGKVQDGESAVAKGDTHSFFDLRTTRVVTHLRDHPHVPFAGETEALDGSPGG